MAVIERDTRLDDLKEEIMEITGKEIYHDISRIVEASYILDEYSEKKPINHECEMNILVY